MKLFTAAILACLSSVSLSDTITINNTSCTISTFTMNALLRDCTVTQNGTIPPLPPVEPPVVPPVTPPVVPPVGGDPGVGSGLWVPPGSSNLYVLDTAKGGITYVPGCMNGGEGGPTDACGFRDAIRASYNGKSYAISAAPGTIVSMRLKPVAKEFEHTFLLPRIHIAGAAGGNIGGKVDVSLSKTPGSFNVDTNCYKPSVGQSITLPVTNKPNNKACVVDYTSPMYYRNCKVSSGCVGKNHCIFKRILK